MKVLLHGLTGLAVFLLSSGCLAQNKPQTPARDCAHFVDPLLGASGGGNVFVGPVVPYGMIKPGPDMTYGVRDYNAGWNEEGPIRGFSQTHVSGTGGGAKYGNFRVQPTTGRVDPQDAASPRSAEHAAAALYGVTLDRYKIGVEITAARRSALYRFSYPAGDGQNLLFDVAHILRSGFRTV